MLFADKKRYGIKEDTFLGQGYIGYLKLCKVKTELGFTIEDAISRDNNKVVCLKKCYSEYLERFAMGISINKMKNVSCINVVDYSVVKRKEKQFAYGNTLFGHNDTTGTATESNSMLVIDKALCELVEKNEVLCFWYSNCGNVIILTEKYNDLIRKCNFISDEIYCFEVNELSQYPTVIVICFKDKKILATGVSCSKTIDDAFEKAIQEAKIMEWQQFRNSEAIFLKLNKMEYERIYEEIMHKVRCMKRIQGGMDKKIMAGCRMELKDWIKDIEMKIIYADEKRGLKTVKCISKELMSSIPIKENIAFCKNKEVVRRYYKDKGINCPIV